MLPFSQQNGVCWSVSALIHAITDAIKARFASVTVRGEISGFSRAASGHCYFVLKDEQGQIKCAMFQRTAQMLSFTPGNGDDVELKGRITIYGQRGELQLTVEHMAPVGQGRLLERFQQRKTQLEREGLFDASRKCCLPLYPSTIGIISSLQAAALYDVLTSLKRRAPHVRAIIYPASVQGAQAPKELCEALQVANQRMEVDALLVCRGGGSLEDLWSFNEEAVVRAMADCKIPIVSGVGHETDFTLADFVADVRAPTPTAAAELVTLAQKDVLLNVCRQEQQLQQQLRYQLEQYNYRLDRINFALQTPAQIIRSEHQKLEKLKLHLQHGMKQSIAKKQYDLQTVEPKFPMLYKQSKQQCDARLDSLSQRWQRQYGVVLQQYQQRLEQLAVRLNALNPTRVLSRGYAWISDEQGHVISSSKALHPGQTIQAQFADGKALASIMHSTPDLLPLPDEPN